MDGLEPAVDAFAFQCQVCLGLMLFGVAVQAALVRNMLRGFTV